MRKENLLISIIASLFITSCNNNDISDVSSSNTNKESNEIISSSNNATPNNKTLITYFSYSGNTLDVAISLKEKLDSDIVRIEPKIPYTSEDVNYNNPSSRSQIERKENARPEIDDKTYQQLDFSNYNNILIGYPIWNGYSPMIIKTFIENELNYLKGKNIYTFSTSASSSGVMAFNELKTNYTELNFIDNMHFTSSTLNNKDSIIENTIESWNLNSKEENYQISLTFQDIVIQATLENNNPANDLLERLKENSLQLEFSDFGNSEKIAYPSPVLKIENESGIDPKVGDIVIYKPWNNIAIFYEDTANFSNDLVLIGKVDSKDITKIKLITGIVNISIV